MQQRKQTKNKSTIFNVSLYNIGILFARRHQSLLA